MGTTGQELRQSDTVPYFVYDEITYINKPLFDKLAAMNNKPPYTDDQYKYRHMALEYFHNCFWKGLDDMGRMKPLHYLGHVHVGAPTYFKQVNTDVSNFLPTDERCYEPAPGQSRRFRSMYRNGGYYFAAGRRVHLYNPDPLQ